jgi:UDP-glucose 4-epimerase
MKNSLKGKNVLVTGGAGFIGSYVCERIGQESPQRLVALDSEFLGNPKNLDPARAVFPDIKYIKADATEIDIVRRVLTENEIDVVFELAVVPLPTSLLYPRYCIDENVKMAGVICELMRAGLFKTLIHFSSSEVYGTALSDVMTEEHPIIPHTPYAASKAAADMIAVSYALTFPETCGDMATLRPFNNFGPRQNDKQYAGVIPIFSHRALRNLPLTIYGDGKQTRDFIYAGDTANAVLSIYETPETRGKTVNVASGRETSILELADMIREITNSKSDIVFAERRAGDVDRHCGGMEIAKNLIGFQPAEKSVFMSQLEKTIEFYESSATE